MKAKYLSGVLGVLVSLGGVFYSEASIDLVSIGYDASNPGGVDYSFGIGKYEVTDSQWASFVSAGGINHSYAQIAGDFDDKDWSGLGNVPATKVSWYDAAQYCNWLTTGNAATGAYQFDSLGNYTGVDRAAASAENSLVYVIPTLDEWNKAAYFNGSELTTYANGTDTIPSQSEANYDNKGYPEPTDVDLWLGGTGLEEQNGTFDMMGNVWEWTETQGGDRGQLIAGGAVHWTQAQWLMYKESGHNSWYAEDGTSYLGFRVASLGSVIPEPSSVIMIAMVSFGGVFIRRWFRM